MQFLPIRPVAYNFIFIPCGVPLRTVIWAISSAGRALDPQSRGRRFDPDIVHHFPSGKSVFADFPDFLFMQRRRWRLRSACASVARCSFLRWMYCCVMSSCSGMDLAKLTPLRLSMAVHSAVADGGDVPLYDDPYAVPVGCDTDPRSRLCGRWSSAGYRLWRNQQCNFEKDRFSIKGQGQHQFWCCP